MTLESGALHRLDISKCPSLAFLFAPQLLAEKQRRLLEPPPAAAGAVTAAAAPPRMPPPAAAKPPSSATGTPGTPAAAQDSAGGGGAVVSAGGGTGGSEAGLQVWMARASRLVLTQHAVMCRAAVPTATVPSAMDALLRGRNL